jgi:hypothetical protein
MHNPKLLRCPSCGGATEPCFSHRAVPLSFLDASAIQKFVHKDIDLNNRGDGPVARMLDGLRTILPSRAEYELAYHCPSCRIFLIEYGAVYSSEEAKAIAPELSAARA